MSFEARDAVDGSLLGTFPTCSADEVRLAVEVARTAGETWSARSLTDRVRTLRAWRGRLWRSSGEIADTLHRESGLSVDEAMLEVLQTVEHLRWVEINAARVLGSTSRGAGLLSPELATRTRYVAEGVVAVMASAYAPLYGPASAVANALVAGNVVLLKPAADLTAVLVAYAEQLASDLPLLQVVTGNDATTAALAAAPLDRVCLFGTAAAAARTSAVSARALVPVTTVPVGPPVTVVAPDADLRAAAESVARTVAFNVARAGTADESGVPEVFVAPDVSEEFDVELRGALAVPLPGTPRLGAGPLARVLGARRPKRLPGVALGPGAPAENLRLRVHGDAEFGEVLQRLRDRPYAHVAVFSRERGQRISEVLRAAQVSINIGATGAEGALPRDAIGSRGYGPLSGDDGLRAFGRAVSITTRRRRALPVPTVPADLLLATPAGKVAARLAMHLRHSLD